MAPPFSLEVRVPASTSNLGCGFDALGLALSLELVVRASTTGDPAPHRFQGSGRARDLPRDGTNLLLRAFELARGRPLGTRHDDGEDRTAEGWAFEVDSQIPVERGLGSSGASVAAGLLLGAELAAARPGDRELLAAGVALEGHPDNVTASLRGGCVLCHPDTARGPEVVEIDPHRSLAFGVAWPDEPLATALARAALPDTVPHATAVDQARRLALLCEGLRAGDPELLRRGQEDRLHIPYRLPLIKGGAAALAAAHEAGAWLATISGSGSALFAIAPQERIAGVVQALSDTLRNAGGTGEGRVVQVVRGRPRVVTR